MNSKSYFQAVVLALAALGSSLASGPENIALAARGGRVASWEPGVPVIPGYEPWRATDGSFQTWWQARPENLPADLGIEWAAPETVSSLIVRYYDGKMTRGPAIARTQQWARLQSWDGAGWRDVDARLVGQETTSVRYVFAPVSTTRMRLLFTEPPDPEGRRTPEPLGIFVCELEAYRDVPFQWVAAPNRVSLAPLLGPVTYTRIYNEPANGDNSYEQVGPLVIEPKQTRILRDTLEPTLIVAESRWAREECSIERASSGSVRLRNGFLELEVSTAGALAETRVTNRVTGESVATPNARAFVLKTSAGDVAAAEFKVARADTSGSDANVSRLRVDLVSPRFEIAVHYELSRREHFYRKWLTIATRNDPVQILDVTVSALGLPRPLDLMNGQELTYPVTRLETGGFFSALEAMYWEHTGDALTCFPGVSLEPGKPFESEKAVVGVFKNRGEIVRGWDRGVREWITEYHASISPLTDKWPDVYAEGWSVNIGLEQLKKRPEWVERTLETAAKMGVGYMDAWESMHAAADASPELVGRWLDLAAKFHIATGWWTDFGSDVAWGDNKPFKPLTCLLAPESETYLKKIVEFTRARKLGSIHWADFYAAYPCENPGHGHLPGKYSIYAQGRRMLEFGEQLRAASPGIMLNSDGGFTSGQSVRYEDSRAHGTFYGGYQPGDHFSTVAPDLHIDRLYADMNRVYEFGSYVDYLRPWFRMLNCVNHYGQETHTHDRAGFRYGVLSAIAMAAQFTVNDVPENIPDSEAAFARRWAQWAREHRDFLKQGDKLFNRAVNFEHIWQGDNEALSGFSHIRGDRGYVFLMNPAPVEQIAELALALDAPQDTRFAVEEVYPGGMSLEGPVGGLYAQGGRLRITVPAKQVRVVSIAPAARAGNTQPEDVRAPAARRYAGEWTLVTSDGERATLRASLDVPAQAAPWLASAVPEADWSREPWGYEKAYLVLLLKNEREDINNNWVPDNMAESMRVAVNGIPRPVHAFKTRRNQPENATRCYFVDLAAETRAGAANQIEVTLPIYKGLTFSGAYLDLPDQMPAGSQ